MKGIIVNLIIGVMTARMDNFVLVIVQNVWSTFIIQVMQKLMRQKGNDCTHMADFYMCKYSYRYTSEIIYALEWMPSLSSEKNLKVLSFGCGPCTDLFAIDYLRVSGKNRLIIIKSELVFITVICVKL